ncbi:MAG: M4 family metallopeptidase, partial [Acidimicrobiia bacterium]
MRAPGERLTRLLGGLLVFAGLVGIDAPADARRAPVAIPDESQLLAELTTRTDRAVTIGRGGPDGAVTFIGSTPQRPLTPPDDRDHGEVARDFAARYGSVFGVDATSSLVEDRRFESPDGGTTVRLRQEHDGVPVLAGELSVRVGANGSVLSSAGEAVPRLVLGTTPTITAAAAADAAIALTARNDAVDAAGLSAGDAELLIYDPALIGATEGVPGTRLVWHVDVRSALGDVDRYVLVDAQTGAIALTFSQVHAVTNVVCDNEGNHLLPAACTSPVVNPGTSGVADVKDAFDLSQATYDYYFTQLGRDSLDGAGLGLVSTVRFCPSISQCPYANAFWNGAQMVYGTGYASADDVVAHELTHGVTDYESELMYYAESGAINESLSDVFGELLDQWNVTASDAGAQRWEIGEDLPIAAIRDMEDPGIFGDPDRVTSPNFWGGEGDQHGVHINSGVNNKAAFLMVDGGNFNGQVVGALGALKTAKIYYEAQTALLTPGSDYLDLYHALPQACTNLLGASGITIADCANVTKAVTATEMHLAPVTSGARLTAPGCSGGLLAAPVFSDDFEAAGPWSTSSSTGSGLWVYTDGSSQSGVRSIAGINLAVQATTEVHMSAPVTIPAGPTYLRFDHSFSFDAEIVSNNQASNRYWDGGIVQYSTNGGGSWSNITALPSVDAINGYNATLRITGNTNTLAGGPAFAGNSPGYQTTRYTISALAGQTAQFRFLIGSDSFVGYPGWFIDDLSIYTCALAPDTPTGVVATPGNGKAALTWTAPADGGSPITSYVITPMLAGVAQTSVTTPSAATTHTVTGLVNGLTYTFVVAAKNAAGTGAASAPSNSVTPIAGFSAVGPLRLVETRPTEPQGAVVVVQQRYGGGNVLRVKVTGVAGVPESGVGAVSLNVTAVQPVLPGFVTVFPCGTLPVAANVNYVAGEIVPNAVIAPVSAAGEVCFFSSADTHLVIDVNGWFAAGAAFSAVGPLRLVETRPTEPQGAVVVVQQRYGGGNVLRVKVTGVA